MKRVYLVFFISVVFLGCATQADYLNVSSVTKYSNEALSDKAESGRGLFNGKGVCRVCHGRDADNYTGIDYRVPSLNPQPTDLRNPNALSYKESTEMFSVIKKGVPRTAMPASAEFLSDREIWALINYLQEIRKK